VRGLSAWWLLLAIAACTPPGAGVTAYVGANVFDGTDTVIADATVLESGGHIVAIGPRDAVVVPRGANVVQLKGRWIIPGLIDGHAHAGESTLSRYLSYGVTSIRHVGGNLDGLTSRARASRTAFRPRLYIAGETINGPPPVGRVTGACLRDAAPAVSRLAAAGVSRSSSTRT
jgi:imidazolonepropionase-like amidohydrolase